jgi:hypothetical protein
MTAVAEKKSGGRLPSAAALASDADARVGLNDAAYAMRLQDR